MPVTDRFAIERPGRQATASADFKVIVVNRPNAEALAGVDIRAEAPGGFLYDAAAPEKDAGPKYRALLPHVSFSGRSVTPVWGTGDGRAVIGWRRREGRRD